jgi:regulator of cell morphogenesis and NO signaling
MSVIETNLSHQTIGEIVREDIRAAKILKRNGIDFCCGGKKTLENACEEKNVNIDKIQEELIDLMSRNNPFPEINPDKWKIDFLCDYIENLHHTYVKQNMPVISELAEKVARVHGEHSPELVKIKELWNEVVKELAPHMQKEELVLFPYIKKLVAISEGRAERVNAHFGTVKNPIAMMEKEHEAAGELLEEIYLLSSSFTLPDWACNSYKLLYNSLAEFREDLHRHIHLENNILFPKAILLEEKVEIN